MKPALSKSLEFNFPLKRGRRRREPLRTTRELADEVGRPVHRLYKLLKMPDAPTPFTRGRLGAYFRPSEFYKWWNSLHIDR